MLSLGIELLMGRAIITRWDNREVPEWPPHPDRLFMTLVAAWGSGGEDANQLQALKWLEALPPPELSLPKDVSVRSEMKCYVPVNDTAEPITWDATKKKYKVHSIMGAYPLGRNRQERFFPAVVPSDPQFFLSWHTDIPSEVRPALEELCKLVTYLGHSATPVLVWIATTTPKSTLTPVLSPTDLRRSTHQLRVFSEGRSSYLISRFNREVRFAHDVAERQLEQLLEQKMLATGKTKKELTAKVKATNHEYDSKYPSGPPQAIRPQPARWQGYAAPMERPDIPDFRGPFDPGMLIFRQVGGRRFGFESCGLIADALRKVLMIRFGENAPEWISGHAADRSVSKLPRPAYLPLGFLGHPHADGHLLGIAVAVPTDFEQTEKLVELLLDPKHGERDGVPFLKVDVFNPHFGERPIGNLELELDERPERSRQQTLQSRIWIGPGHAWATVTPIMLPQFPRRGLSVEEVVATACLQSGLPEPATIRAGLAPFLAGVPHARSFHVKPRAGRPPRPLFHAEMTFPVPVLGPVLIGAGRYAGYGVCRPLKETPE